MGEETDVTSEDEVRCGGREAEGGVLLADLEMEVRQDLKWQGGSRGFPRSVREAGSKRREALHTVGMAKGRGLEKSILGRFIVTNMPRCCKNERSE